jgi:hypothetical protein
MILERPCPVRLHGKIIRRPKALRVSAGYGPPKEINATLR